MPKPAIHAHIGIVAISGGAGDVTIITGPAPDGVIDVSATPNPPYTSSLGIFGCSPTTGSVTMTIQASVLSHDGLAWKRSAATAPSASL